MYKPFIVIDIGCLECYHASWFMGRFSTVKEAQAKYPSAITDAERRRKGWQGESVQVIFDMRKPHTPYLRNQEA